MNLITRLKNRVAQAKLEVEAAHDVIAKAERQAKKEKTIIPPFQMDAMMAEVRFCRDQVFSAECALAGASKFPPLNFWSN